MLKEFPKFIWKDEKSTATDNSAFILKDLSVSIRLYESTLARGVLWNDYYLKVEDTPEIISYNVYGTTKYWWLIMLANNIIDYTSDMPLSGDNLVTFIKEKYGFENDSDIFKPMFYRDPNTGIVTHVGDIEDFSYVLRPSEEPNEETECDLDDSGRSRDVNRQKLGEEVSYYQYEYERNENRKVIKVVNPLYLDIIDEELEKLLNANNTN